MVRIRITGEDQPAVWLEVPPNTKSICTITAPKGWCLVSAGVGGGLHGQRFMVENEVKYLKMGEDFRVVNGLETIAQGRCEVSTKE